MKSKLLVAMLAAAIVCTVVTLVPAQQADATQRTVIGELYGRTS
jgi:hypothetical protein